MTTLSANKNLGQHYLNNQATIEKISNDFEGKYDAIIEVGRLQPLQLLFQRRKASVYY